MVQIAEREDGFLAGGNGDDLLLSAEAARSFADLFPQETLGRGGDWVEWAGRLSAAGQEEDGDGLLLAGGNGQDVLIGGGRSDLLIGGRGDDLLAGGQGDDDLVGGRGADRFLVGEGKDVVIDFDPQAGDKVDFGEDVGLADLVARQTPQGVWITIGDGGLNDPETEGVLLVGLRAVSAAEVTDWIA